MAKKIPAKNRVISKRSAKQLARIGVAFPGKAAPKGRFPVKAAK